MFNFNVQRVVNYKKDYLPKSKNFNEKQDRICVVRW